MICEKIKIPEFEKTFNLERINLIVQIKRLLPIDSTIFKKYKLLCVQNTIPFRMSLLINKDPLILPKLFVALTYLTGPSDTRYDHYKGSYSFTFELEVKKNNNVSNYLFHVYHYRSCVEINVHQFVSKTDPRDDHGVYQPDSELFSAEDISYFSQYFIGYCEGYIEGCKYVPLPFWKCSDSNLLLFGYREGEYFIESYDNEDEYDQAKHALESQEFYSYGDCG